jgi:glycine/D-amino acid oxidase-like deaminating enzyme
LRESIAIAIFWQPILAETALPHFDVVVVGSGALGSSAAYHLTRAGRRVALIDKAALGSQTSPRAAGLTGQLRRNEVMTRLAVRSVEKITRFAEDTGEPLVFHQPGSLNVARTPKHVDQLEKAVAYGRHLGLDIELISPQQGHDLMPFLQTKGVLAVTHMRTDLYLEPAQIASGYSKACEKLGAVLLPNTTVLGIGIEKGGISRVLTDRGDISTGVVVDAAGAWLRSAINQSSLSIPIVPTRHQLLITTPIPGVSTTQPIVRIIDANVYVRPERGGLMLGGYEKNPRAYPCDLPASFGIEDLELDLAVLRRLGESVHEQFPIFREATLQEHRGGLPTMTPDGEHVVGEAPGVRGLFLLGGCNVGGLSISPALGEQIAEWITKGAPSMDLARMSPARFKFALNDTDVVKASLARYEHYYSPPPLLPSAF